MQTHSRAIRAISVGESVKGPPRRSNTCTNRDGRQKMTADQDVGPIKRKKLLGKTDPLGRTYPQSCRTRRSYGSSGSGSFLSELGYTAIPCVGGWFQRDSAKTCSCGCTAGQLGPNWRSPEHSLWWSIGSTGMGCGQTCI